MKKIKRKNKKKVERVETTSPNVIPMEIKTITLTRVDGTIQVIDIPTGATPTITVSSDLPVKAVLNSQVTI